MRKTSRGFSLIELLIVVAIILIIAAIAIPNLLRSRIAANQASAVGSLRTLVTSEVTYATTYNTGYSSKIQNLGPPAAGSQPTATDAGLVDNVLGGCPTASTTACDGSPLTAPSSPTPPTPTNAAGYTYQTSTYASKSGYYFEYAPAVADAGTSKVESFQVYAFPVVVGTTGTDYYFTDESGVIRMDTTAAATYISSPLAG